MLFISSYNISVPYQCIMSFPRGSGFEMLLLSKTQKKHPQYQTCPIQPCLSTYTQCTLRIKTAVRINLYEL